MNPVWIYGIVTAFVLFQLAAIPGLLLKKNDVADVLWGPAFPLSMAAAIVFGTPLGFSHLDYRPFWMFVIVSIWALRLFSHVGLRNLSTLQEDVRYNNWRRQWGKTQLWRSYLQVFVLQPLILCVFLSPLLHAVASPPRHLGFLFFAGVLVWATGFFIESLADEQLRKFKSDARNRGKLMTSGIWSWSRHPNYFGEVTQWWGLWLMVVELPYGWATVVSPIGVTYLILKVSGVSMLEDLMRERPGFTEYARRTSVFIPLPPKTN